MTGSHRAIERRRQRQPIVVSAAIDIATYRLAVLTGRVPGDLTESLKGAAELVVRGDLVPVAAAWPLPDAVRSGLVVMLDALKRPGSEDGPPSVPPGGSR